MNTDSKLSLLVVDDDTHVLGMLSQFFTDEFVILTAESAAQAREIVDQRQVDLVLTDQCMPGGTGVELLEWVRQRWPGCGRLLMTGRGDLADAVDAINRGMVSRYVCKPWRPEELRQVLRDAGQSIRLQRQNDQLLDELRKLNLELEARVRSRTQQVEEAYRELQQKNLMLEKLALTDSLTGLPNRRAMDRLAESEIRRRTRYPSPLAIGIVDVDHFKQINQDYLLPGGDQVLIEMARVLNASVRTVDTVGRIGGEEFMVVAPETNLEGATVLAERIRSGVESHSFAYKHHNIRVSVSVGFAVAETGATAEYDQLKHCAAAALGEAKASGRNRSLSYSMPLSVVS